MSGVEFLQTAVTEIAKPVVNIILQELDYLLRPQKYINKMNLLVQPLKDNHKIVDDAVVEARRFGKDINPEVEKWLETAGDIIAQAELLLDSNTKRCLNGWCVDFGSRYKINKGAVEISDRITKALPPTPESKSVAHPPPPPTVLCDPDFMEFESTKETMQQITVALKDAECGIVGIFGMGGIGKTTIVKKIAEKVKQDKQFDQVVMAVVSQSPDLKKIQDQIASMLDLNLDQRAEVEGRASQLRKRLMNAKTILVILDDLWARLDLTKIGIPGCIEHKGCKVLLTTRSEDVCTSMGTGNGKKIKVGVLSTKESWELFKSNAGDGIDAPPLKEVAAKVMNECQGLPLALETVGRALRDKDIRQWESAELQLKNSRYTQIDGMSKEVISCLRLSYDYLESDEMKACFLVCCLFPEDSDICIEILVRYAIGKGLFGYVSTIDEARTLIETTLRKLKASCLLLEGEGEYAEEEYVKVHDVVRDVGLSIALEDKLVSINRPDLGQWLQRNSMKHVKGACFATKEVISLPEGIQCPELEELIMIFGEQGSYSDTFFQTMKKLKVLIHLGPSRLPTSIKCLVSLRTLHLVGCALGYISAALGELQMLEILTINRTRIESFPVEVGQLRNLRLLHLMGNRYLERIPGNVISQLSQLEELWIGTESFDDWEIEEGTSGDAEEASLSELQSLPRLAILCIGVREFAQFPPRFSLPNKLVKFEIRLGEVYKYGSLDGYPTSRKLTLGRGEFQMEGVKSLLRLIDSHNGHEDESSKSEFTSNGNGSRYVLTDFAGGLNGLDSLRIESVDWISYLTRCASANDKVVPPVFANLHELSLRNILGLRGLGCGGGIELEGTATSTTARGGGLLPPGSLRNLKALHIHWCNGLGGWAVPSSWTHRLHSLQSVNIQDCSNVEGLFEVEEQNNNSTRIRLLSNLRKIKLWDLPELRSLTNGESSTIHFSNLREVIIYKCDSLVSVFTPNVVSQGLVHLEALKISYCRDLKAIFEESDSNSSSSQETQTSSTTTFPNLKSVYVEKCEQLKCLFTVSMANGLPKLEELQLRHNRNLEEIVCCNLHRAAAAVKENMEINDAQSSSITWPQIRTIFIQDSRQLKRFIPENSYIEMPMLQGFGLINCSDWMENFAADPPAHGLNIPQSAKIYEDRRR